MPFFIHLCTYALIPVCSVLGYNLIFGRGKILHFGHVGVIAVGMYAIFLTQLHTGSYALGLLAGVITALAVSGLLALLALRLEADASGVMTIAFHLIVLSFIRNLSDFTRGDRGIAGIQRLPILADNLMFLAVVVVVSVLSVLCGLWLMRRPFGRALVALAEHPWYAAAVGISRRKVTVMAFMIAGICALVSNFFFHQYIYFLHPSDLGFPALVFDLTAIVAGGPGAVVGVAIATILMTLVHEGLRFVHLPAELVGPIRLILFGVILFVAVWIRRKHLFPAQRSV